MRLVDVLRPELVFPAIRAVRKDDVIRELATGLARSIEDVSPEDIVNVLVERERQGSTAIGEGVAIPHAKLDTLNDLAACLGYSRKGVDFGSVDGKPTHFFFVVVSPPNSAGSHLKLLARFSQLFRDAGFRARLMAAETAGEMYRIIAEEDAK